MRAPPKPQEWGMTPMHRVHRAASRASALSLILAVAACAQVQVRSLGTAPGQPAAFELRSRTLAQLQTEAQRLCPKGHTVLREWQAYQRGEVEGNPVLQRLQQAQDFIGVGDAHEAQATLQCKP